MEVVDIDIRGQTKARNYIQNCCVLRARFTCPPAFNSFDPSTVPLPCGNAQSLRFTSRSGHAHPALHLFRTQGVSHLPIVDAKKNYLSNAEGM